MPSVKAARVGDRPVSARDRAVARGGSRRHNASSGMLQTRMRERLRGRGGLPGDAGGGALRREFGISSEASTVDVLLRGVVQRMHHFVLRIRRECAATGGVPERVVFDITPPVSQGVLVGIRIRLFVLQPVFRMRRARWRSAMFITAEHGSENFNAGLPDRCAGVVRNRITARTSRRTCLFSRTNVGAAAVDAGRER